MKYIFLIICFTCTLLCASQTYIEPVFDRTDCTELHINKIEVTKDTTYVHCTYIAEKGSWARISKDTYLYDHDKHKKYTILKCDGFPFSPQQRDFTYGGAVQITFCFPSIGNAAILDFIEEPNEDAFNIYGINVKERFETVYKESDYEHFSRMSSIFDNAGNDSLAIQYKKREMEAAQYIHGIMSMEYSMSLLLLCVMYDKYGFSEESINGMKHLLNIYNGIWGEKYKYNYALSVRTLAQFYSHASYHEMSIKTYKEAIELFESLHAMDKEYALALRFIAFEYDEIGDDESSLFYQQKAVEVRRIIGDSDKYIEELYNVALTTSTNKEIVKNRIHIVEKELELLPDFVNSNSVVFVDIYEKLAFIFSLQDNYEKTLRYCDKALTLLEGIGEHKSEKYAEFLGLKCRYQQQAHYWYEAITTGKRSMQIFEMLHVKSLKYAGVLCDLSVAYMNIYDYEQSIRLREQACEIFEASFDWLSLVESFQELGNLYQYKRDFDKSELYIRRSLEILSDESKMEQYENSGEVVHDRILREKSRLYYQCSKLLLIKGEKNDAIETGKHAIDILMAIPEDEDIRILYTSFLATIYRDNHQFEEALISEEQCLKYWEGHGNKEEMASSQYAMAYIYWEKGDTLRAMDYANKAVLLSKTIADKLYVVEGLAFLSKLYYESAQYEDAEESLSEALDFIQTMLQSEMKGMTSEQRQRIWNKYRNLFFLYRQIVDKDKNNEVKLSKLYNYALFSKNVLVRLGPDVEKNVVQKVTWKEIRNKLSKEDVAIEFIATIDEITKEMTYYTYHALAIDKDSQYPRMITLVHEKELANRQGTIGDLIWNPILTEFPDAKNLYFSPDGVWHVFPIENLLMTDPFLLDEYNLYRLSSTAELVKSHQETTIKSAAIYGGLTYSVEVPDFAMTGGERADFYRGVMELGGFEPLYGTLDEVNSISELLKQNNVETTLCLEEDGTEQSFKQLAGKGLNLIHLATHGMFVGTDDVAQQRLKNNFEFLEPWDNDNPVYENILLTHSFLVMAGGNKLIQREKNMGESDDGILTAQEISGLDLSGVDLVVLSACETARGELTMDGNCGLPWGFKKAGANTILMSLDKVDDEATKILMVEFYRNLMLGKSKLQSLKNARKFLREYDNGKYHDPEYWASFIMLDGLD